MAELIIVVVILLVIAGVSVIGPIRDRIWIHRSIRDDYLLKMSKVNPESTLHTEFAIKALRHDALADNAWRQDIDDVIQMVKDRKSDAVAIRGGASEPIDLSRALDTARLTVIEDAYNRVHNLVAEVQAIEAAPEHQDALAGIVHDYSEFYEKVRKERM